MRDFVLGIDLWANVVGGIVSAAILALVAYLWHLRKHRILNELSDIMEKAIKHRQQSKGRKFTDEEKEGWIGDARKIECDATKKAKKLSHTASSLIAWKDKVPAEDDDSEVERHISHLNTIIDRIRGLMERHA